MLLIAPPPPKLPDSGQDSFLATIVANAGKGDDMADQVQVDQDAWEDHARWWDQERTRAVAAMDVTEADLEAARTAFGKLGASTVGQAYAEVLEARRVAGQRLGAYAQGVADHIRADMATYRDNELAAAAELAGP